MAEDRAGVLCSRCGQAEGPAVRHIHPAGAKEVVQGEEHIDGWVEGRAGVQSRRHFGPAVGHSEVRTTDSEAGREGERRTLPNLGQAVVQSGARTDAAGCCSSCCLAGLKGDVVQVAGQGYHPCQLFYRNTSPKEEGKKVFERYPGGEFIMQFVQCRTVSFVAEQRFGGVNAARERLDVEIELEVELQRSSSQLKH